MRTSLLLLSGALALAAAGCAGGPEPGAASPAQPAASAAQAGPARPVPQVVGGQRLSGEEFRRLVFGNTLDRRLPNGSRLTMHIAADGSQRLRLVGVGGQTATDRGRVVVQGDEVCSSWEKIEGGRPTCFAWFRLGESLVAIDVSGAISPTRFELLRGNPERI
ncbi:hypothetical protein [Caldovatus aquaticus]|uniref:Lipoprotein n=1 Tax=Caldovatus aquaticus TaxID=2865671 RepID=A0ABS7EY99_9PROT|nr:hypothetical protein [Caldovatus aquaticus]MBW8268335.1 hypothetical protein [Caldovatus aquaticus]